MVIDAVRNTPVGAGLTEIALMIDAPEMRIFQLIETRGYRLMG